MWNLIMWLWLVGGMCVPIYVIFRSFKSKPISWSEFFFFAVGLLIGAIPSFYVLHLLKIVSN